MAGVEVTIKKKEKATDNRTQNKEKRKERSEASNIRRQCSNEGRCEEVKCGGSRREIRHKVLTAGKGQKVK